MNDMATLQTMLVNLAKNYPAIKTFIEAFCYVFAFGFLLRSIFHLKIYGQMRVMMAASASLQPAILYWFVGSLLLFIPTTYEVLLATIFGTKAPEAFQYTSSDPVGVQAFKSLVILVQIIGWITVVKGIMLLLRIGSQGQPGVLGRTITHIAAGTLLINIIAFNKILFNTVGIVFA